jgi:hypothetical protein
MTRNGVLEDNGDLISAGWDRAVRGRVIGRGSRAATAAVLVSILGLLLTPALAAAAATMTDPTDGARLHVDRRGLGTFTWTLPVGEVGPEVLVGDTPKVLSEETFYPFEEVCGATGEGGRATSCKTEDPLPAGRHYAFIWTRAGEQGENEYSPVTSFTVPPLLDWNSDLHEVDAGKAVETGIAFTAGPPESELQVFGWSNDEGARVVFDFTISHGNRVLKRYRNVQISTGPASGPVPSGVSIGPVASLRFGTPLTCRIVMRSDGITLSRTARMKAA